jgi:hypothetical protein
MDVALSLGHVSNTERHGHANRSEMILLNLPVGATLFNSDARLEELVHPSRAVLASFDKVVSNN